MSAVVMEVREPSARYVAQAEPPVARAFNELACSPAGVGRLQKMIRSLAVQGRLLPQSGSDQSAADLVMTLRKGRQRLLDAGRIRKERGSEEEAAALDFELPHGWEVVRLADVAWPQAGFAFKSSAFNDVGQGLPLIRIRDVGSSSPTTYYAGEFREEFVVHKGDWLISMDGDFRVAPWTGPDALLNQRVTRLVFFGDAVQPLYVCLALQQELFKLQGTKAYTTVDHLSGGQIASRPIPLPPLAEQHRIVARVEELMKLCDVLEAQGRLADEQHARLTSTLFGLLAASESPQALAENWQRIAEHFDLLLDRPEAIDALEQTIIQLAVRGSLVPQDANEEPASCLLARVSSEKSVAAAAASGRWAKKTAPVTANEQRFELPSSWAWARLDDLSIAVVDCPHSTPKFVQSGVLCIDTNSFKGGALLPHKLRYVDEATYAERVARLTPRPGDLVFAREGTVGESLIIPSDTKSCLGQRVMLFRLSTHVFNEFIRMAISSNDFLARLLELHKGIGAKHVNVGDMRDAVVPLPPLAEQHRIVARVDELRRLCAQLRERLVAARQTQTRLADALVAQAVG